MICLFENDLKLKFEKKTNINMSVRVIDDENHFQAELQAAGVRLVVVDFTASW